MTLTQKFLAERIYDTIATAKFSKWYGLGESSGGTNGDFDGHIRGDVGCLKKDEILEQIVKLFHL